MTRENRPLKHQYLCPSTPKSLQPALSSLGKVSGQPPPVSPRLLLTDEHGSAGSFMRREIDSKHINSIIEGWEALSLQRHWRLGLFLSGQVIKSLQGDRKERTEMYTMREKTGRKQIKHTLYCWFQNLRQFLNIFAKECRQNFWRAQWRWLWQVACGDWTSNIIVSDPQPLHHFTPSATN